MSLAEKLAQIRAGSADRIPAESLQTMHDATEALRNSGIMEGIVMAGDPMPDFELPNVAGATVSSSDLLAEGPLVVTFYRGVW